MHNLQAQQNRQFAKAQILLKICEVLLVSHTLNTVDSPFAGRKGDKAELGDKSEAKLRVVSVCAVRKAWS